jgi:hypothetical protein
VARLPQPEIDRICGTTAIPGGYLGGCQSGEHLVYSNPRAVLHEFGHLLWLNHVPAGVMQAVHQGIITEFSADDRAELFRVWG